MAIQVNLMPIPSEAGTRQHKIKCLPSTFHHSHSLANTLHFKTFFTLYNYIHPLDA